jgi:Tfp pilus assembly protein PilO
MKLGPEKARQFVLTLILVLGVLGAVWYLFVQGLIARREKDEKEKESLATKVAEQKKAYETEIRNRDVAKVYRDFIARCEKQVPQENVETWLVREVSAVSSRHNLQIANTMMHPPREGSDLKFRNQPYHLEGFVFDLEGEYNQIGRFLEDLENSMPLAEVDEMEFAAGTGSARHIHKASVRLTMVTR